MKEGQNGFGRKLAQKKKVEHDYCYSVGEIAASTRQNYLQQADRLGNEFVQQGDNHA